MIIHIGIEEISSEYRRQLEWGMIKSVHMDYATNALHGFLDSGEEVIFFRFKDYGFIHDNRFNKYSISSGPAGITIKITETRSSIQDNSDL